MNGIAGTVSWDQGVPPTFSHAIARWPFTLSVDGDLYSWPDDVQGTSDAERLLHAAHHGSARLCGLEGDFAFAQWDARGSTLTLARERFGLRPLYYACTKQGAAFASRIRTLVALTGMPIKPRPAYVARYAASHYRTFDDEEALSPFEGVMQVPAGSMVVIDARGARTTRYWQLQDHGDLDNDEQELAERLRDLLHAAVARRTQRSDRPMFTLSGGMDSSSVLFAAAQVMNEKPVACSAVYEHAEYDESNEIRASLEGTGIAWHAIEVDNTLDVEMLAEAVRAHDEPLPTATWLAHYQLCQAAAKLGATELFDGLGGDELNAGEYEYFPYFFADLQADGTDAFENEIACWATLHDHPIHKKSRDVALAMIEQLVDGTARGRCRPNAARTLRYANVLDDGAELLRAFKPTLAHPFRTWLKNRTYQDLTRETMPCCLRASHRNTTAAGLVNRSPFLDRELVEFMFQIPGTMKIRDGVTKHLLREAMRGVLPEVTRARTKKVGWNAPSDRWFVGAGADMIRDLVGAQRFRERGIYRVDRLRALIDEHEVIVTSEQSRENHMMLLWQVLNLDLWLCEVDDMQREASRARVDDRIVTENALANGIERCIPPGREVVR